MRLPKEGDLNMLWILRGEALLNQGRCVSAQMIRLTGRHRDSNWSQSLLSEGSQIGG